MKGIIQPNHMAVNKFQLIVAGMPPLTITQISGIEEKLDTVEMPDRTKVTGGNTRPVEFTMMMPAHHALEQAAMEAWFAQTQDPVDPGYKKVATLIIQRIGPGLNQTRSLAGVFPMGRKTPELEMKNEGDMAQIEWSMSSDEII